MESTNKRLLNGQLLFAVECGDVTAVERLINGGCILDNPTTENLLFHAVRENQNKMVEFILNNSHHVSRSIAQRCIQFCISHLLIDTAETLLARIIIDFCDLSNVEFELTFEKKSPLQTCLDMLDLLSRYKLDINIAAALKSAAREQKLELVKRLLIHVDDSFLVEDAGKMLQIAYKDLSLMEILFKCKCLRIKFTSLMIDEAFDDAFLSGNSSAAQFLITVGACTSSYEPVELVTFLGDRNTLEELISTEQITVVDHPHLLHIAVRAGHCDIARLLVNSNWDVNAEIEFLFHRWGNSKTVTPLSVAAYFGHLDTVEFLLENAAEIEKGLDHYATALYWATMSGHVDIITLLLDAGADGGTGIAIVGLTALHLAVNKSLPIYVIKKLIKHGAKVNAHKAIGCIKGTPLGIALRNGYVEAVAVLLENGADAHTSESLMKYNPVAEPLVIIAKSYGESVDDASITIDMINLVYRYIDLDQMPNTCMAALEQTCMSRNVILLRNMLTNFQLDVVEYWFHRNVSLREHYRMVDFMKHSHSALSLIETVILSISHRLPRVMSEFFLIYESVICNWYELNPYSLTFLLQLFSGYPLHCYQLPDSIVTAVVKNSDFDNMYIMYSNSIVTSLFNVYLNRVTETNEEFLIQAKCLLSTPPKLLCLCRNVIHHQIISKKQCLGLQNGEIESLPIGLSLKNYLMFRI